MASKKIWLIMICIVLIGIIIGRLAVRGFLNLLMGGTLFGGNFLWGKKIKGGEECLYLFV